MKAWEHIINTAMLGTDKPNPASTELPADIAPIAVVIDAAETLDKEEKYLQKAALIYNYRQSGFTPLNKNDLPINKADAEVKPYVSDSAANVLNEIMETGSDPLLEFWLAHCHKKDLLFTPDVLPVILDKAKTNIGLRPLAIACSGNRGGWLSKLNPAWDFFTTQPDDEIWQNGTLGQRSELLKQVRQTDPDKARELLQQTWPQENGIAKTELLKALKVNADTADLPWLESLLQEKGQKVKDEVLALLKLIPASSIVRQYESLLRESVTLKKEKAMLGMLTKTSIQQKLPAVVDEGIFKSGIEKLAGQKSSVTDETYVIYQLIASVPPAFWEKQFDATPGQVVAYFEKHALSQIGALAKAVSTFNADSWIPYFLDQAGIYPDFINKLPPAQRDKYLLKFFANDAAATLRHAFAVEQEWGLDFTKAALGYMAANPYTYNRADFNRHIQLCPVGIISVLERIDATQPNLQPTWEKSRNHLIKLLGLKQQTLQAFNA